MGKGLNILGVLCVCVAVCGLGRAAAEPEGKEKDASAPKWRRPAASKPGRMTITRDGSSKVTSLRSIQKAVEALQPGDILTIGPGEYHENVKVSGLGDLSKETIIRAEIPGTVVLRDCPDSVIENNVCIMTILRQLECDSPATARRNIFCECVRNKTHQTLLQLSSEVKESDNCFYLRWPEEEKLAINDMPLPKYRARTGSNSFAANPMMPGVQGQRQGWPSVPENGDFDVLFATNPKLILRDIGLQPEAFSDFKLGVTDWPYDRAWAEKFTEAADAAAALPEAGENSKALAAYVSMTKELPMSDRLKADVLEKASLCAQRLKNYGRAMELAKQVPVEVIAMHRQMQLMLEQKQYAELLNTFSNDRMGGRDFCRSFRYPELEDVMADLYYYRALAYIHTGNLTAAEADLKVMNDKRTQLSYRCGEAIHDLTWLRLGDFYRTHLKDDARALEAYLNVCNRTTWAPWGRPRKPVSTGGSETLVKATRAASEILRRQGKLGEVKKLESNLAKAQAEAAADMLK